MTTGGDLLAVALTQKGRRYIYAAQPDPSIVNPSAFDCSGFTRWVAGRCGVTIPLGSWIQKAFCQAHGGLIPLEQARHTPGALIGHDGQGPEGHVAMVASYDLTMEARGSAYGCGQFPISGRPFQWGLLIPGVDYSGAPNPVEVLMSGYNCVDATWVSSKGCAVGVDSSGHVFFDADHAHLYNGAYADMLMPHPPRTDFVAIEADDRGYTLLTSGLDHYSFTFKSA